jgi:hypothetical protein
METKALQPAWHNPKFNVSSKIVLGECKIMVTIARELNTAFVLWSSPVFLYNNTPLTVFEMGVELGVESSEMEVTLTLTSWRQPLNALLFLPSIYSPLFQIFTVSLRDMAWQAQQKALESLRSLQQLTAFKIVVCVLLPLGMLVWLSL